MCRLYSDKMEGEGVRLGKSTNQLSSRLFVLADIGNSSNNYDKKNLVDS